MTAVERLIPLAQTVGGRMRSPRWMTKEDRQQEAVLGLLQAAKTYDPNKGASLKTFAYPRIRGAVVDACRAGSTVSRRGLAKGETLGVTFGLLDDEVVAGGTDVPSLASAAEESKLIGRAVAALPDELRFVVEGIYWRGLSQSGLVVDIDKSNVSRRHSKATAFLRGALSNLCPTAV